LHPQKQKVQQESVVTSNLPVSQQAAQVIRQFPQKQPVANNAGRAKPRLSKDILAGVSVSLLIENYFIYVYRDFFFKFVPQFSLQVFRGS
jgi:hypothetical protein